MKIYLVEMTGYDPASSTVKTYRFSNGSGYVSAPGDTPAHTFYEPRLSQPGLYKQDMYSDGATSGRSSGGYGVIELINKDGALDYLLDIGFDGRLIVVKSGLVGQPLSTFASIITGTCEQLVASWDKVTVRLRDNTSLLTVPVQPVNYAGTNSLPDGVEGCADLKDKPKPRLLGSCINMTPPCVNTSKLIFQLSDRGLSAIPVVYDGGVTLAVGVARATVADLLANAPAAGTFDYVLGDASSPAYIRLGSNPAFTITFDGTSAYGGLTVGQICKTLASEKLPAGSIVEQSIIDMDAASSAVVGIYTGTDSKTVADCLDMLCPSAGAWWGFDNSGKFWCKQLQAPVAAQAVSTLTVVENQSIERVATTDPDKGIPPYKIKIQYARNWTVQSSGLAGIIGAGDILTAEMPQTPLSVDRATRLMMEYFTTNAEDTAVNTLHKLSPEIPITTVLANKTDADAEAARVLAMRKTRRDRLKVMVSMDALTYPAGGAWDNEAISEMLHGRYGHKTVVYNQKLIVIGGYDMNNNRIASVIMSDLSNPTGPWDDTSITDLPSPRANHTAVIHNNYLYVIGGSTSSGISASVIRLDLSNPSGAWEDAGVTDLPDAREKTAAVVYNNYLYVFGGWTNSGKSASVIRLNLSSPSGAWDDAGVSDMPYQCNDHTANIYGSYVYITGGSTNYNYGDPVTFVIRLNLSNPSAAWDDSGVSDMPIARTNHAAVVMGDFIYVLGGQNGEGDLANTMRLPLLNSTSDWDNIGVAELPAPRNKFCAIVYNRSVYVVGGYASGGQANTWRLRTNENPDDASQLFSLGRTILLKYARYGYSNGRPMRIIGTETDYASNIITLDLWG